MRPHHYGVTVSKLEEALEFYQDILGFDHKNTKTVEGEVVSHIVGVENAKADVAFLEAGEFYLELFEYHPPEAPLYDGRQPNNAIGASHLAIEITNVNDWFDKYKDEIDFVNLPIEGTSGATVLYTNDPDGNVVEIVEKDTWKHW